MGLIISHLLLGVRRRPPVAGCNNHAEQSDRVPVIVIPLQGCWIRGIGMIIPQIVEPLLVAAIDHGADHQRSGEIHASIPWAELRLPIE